MKPLYSNMIHTRSNRTLHLAVVNVRRGGTHTDCAVGLHHPASYSCNRCEYRTDGVEGSQHYHHYGAAAADYSMYIYMHKHQVLVGG